jgi:methyltransferase (TIGR00027 family)
MRDAGPSRTAIAVAIQRAVHQTVDRPPIFSDPLAARIIGPKARAAIAEGRAGRGVFASVLRTVLVVRARVAEDTLAEAVADGVRQYVVLGAGLDTFGLRNADPSLHVFEVDHSNTQAWKRRRIEEEGLVVPTTLRFVPVDFTKDDLAVELRRAGLRPDQDTFFSWLGVVMYLEHQSIRGTLQTVAALCGSTGGIAFDFIAPPRRSQLHLRMIMWWRGCRVARLGEPFRAPLSPVNAERWLREAGFREVTILTPQQLTERYLRGRRLRTSPLSYVAVARDGPIARSNKESCGMSNRVEKRHD